MRLLALETATTTCGVAVMVEDEVTAQVHLHRPRVHSERLTPLVEDVLEHGGVDRASLDVVAVSMGPGSYTGLRIGVSTAKGWALAAEAKLIGVPTLEALATQVRPFAGVGDVVCVLLEARHEEVYAGAYRVEEEGIAEHAPTKALPVEALPEWLGTVDGRLWIVGDGGEMAEDDFSVVDAPHTRIPADELVPSASSIARVGRRRLDTVGAADLDSFEPFYVKDVHATPASSPFE